MTIDIHPAALGRLGVDDAGAVDAAPGPFAVLVRGLVSEEQRAAATSALRLARVDLLGLLSDGHTSVSTVAPAPAGPVVLVEEPSTNVELRRQVPEVVARRLELAGVTEAVVEVPTLGGLLDDLEPTGPALVLRLYPNGAAFPSDWFDAASDWLAGMDRAELGETDPALAGVSQTLRVRLAGVEWELSFGAALDALSQAAAVGAWCDVVAGTTQGWVRVASVAPGRSAHLVLAEAGPGTVDRSADVAAHLQDLARELAADLRFGCLSLEPDLELLAVGPGAVRWDGQEWVVTDPAQIRLDLQIPDAFPFQVLGPAHVAALEGHLSLERLGDGRAELVVGEVAEWAPDHPDHDSRREHGRELLWPCLIDPDDPDVASLARVGHASELAPAGAADLDVVGHHDDDLPELTTIVLEPRRHPHRGDHLTVLELAAWLAREPHSDDPASVSPVTKAFVRPWAAALTAPERQALLGRAARLVGTAASGDDDARALRAASWLVTTAAPGWLDAAGLDNTADRLRDIGSLDDPEVLRRAIDLLSSAALVTSRRFDLTAALVGVHDDPELLDAAPATSEAAPMVRSLDAVLATRQPAGPEASDAQPEAAGASAEGAAPRRSPAATAEAGASSSGRIDSAGWAVSSLATAADGVPADGSWADEPLADLVDDPPATFDAVGDAGPDAEGDGPPEHHDTRFLDVPSSPAFDRAVASSTAVRTAWDAWDAAVERGLIAPVADAAGVGVDPEVRFAVEQRVMEVTQDRDARDELGATRRTLTEVAEAAALSTAARRAWDAAWDAADATARHHTSFTIRVELGRAGKALRRGLDLDGETPDLSLEVAESAAVEALTRHLHRRRVDLVDLRTPAAEVADGTVDLRGPSRPAPLPYPTDLDGLPVADPVVDHPWDHALAAAAASAGGVAWASLMTDARTVIGDGAWAEAMEAARHALDEAIEGLEVGLQRTVAVAIAREASSVAARSAALRAYAAAAASGASQAERAEAAEHALRDTADALRAATFELFDALS